MATNSAAASKRTMEYRKVAFDVHEIAPDAPEGEWGVSIPRGKCKVQPTKEDRYPMLIVPIRLDKTDEDGEAYEKALGVELSVMIVFFGDEKPRAARLSKIRLRQLCEAADVDLDVIPKELGDDPENELEPLIRELEGKKFSAWTVLQTRKDTGEVTSEVKFLDPHKTLASSRDGEDEEEEEEEGEEEERKPARSSKKKKKKASKRTTGKTSRR